MKQYIYMHTMYGYTNKVQTKASVKLPINFTPAGYLLYLGIKNVKNWYTAGLLCNKHLALKTHTWKHIRTSWQTYYKNT